MKIEKNFFENHRSGQELGRGEFGMTKVIPLSFAYKVRGSLDSPGRVTKAQQPGYLLAMAELSKMPSI